MAIVSIHPAETLTGLALYRRDLGISQREAARLAGISRSHLQRLEAEPQFTPASLRLALTYVALRVLVGAGPVLLARNGRETA